MKKKSLSLSYAKVFLLSFFAILLVAFVVRMLTLYMERSFKENSFNLLVVTDDKAIVIGIDKAAKEIFVVKVSDETRLLASENLALVSVKFSIPIHSRLIFPEKDLRNVSAKKVLSLQSLLSTYFDRDIKRENMTIFDFMSLAIEASSIKWNAENVLSYSSLTELESNFFDENSDKFRDSLLSKRKTSLEVVNGTNIGKIGSRVSAMFTRAGFNVVSVDTGSADSSVIYINKETFLDDAKLVQKVFNYPIITNTEHNIASVTLIIGEDNSLLFENLE